MIPISKTQLTKLIQLAYRPHNNCEMDTWYGCPLSVDGCSQDIPRECNCGAEQHNKEVAEIVKALSVR